MSKKLHSPAKMFIFFLVYNTTDSLSAQGATALQVDNQISKAMSLKVEQGVCQKTHAESLSEIRVFSTKSKNQKLYAAPCSLWAHNQAWSFFLVIDNSPQGFLVKPIFFIRHSSYKGLYADSVVENISWDADKNILTSREYLNGHQHCGELAGYQWQENAQDFKTLSIYKNDNCKITNKPWKKAL